MSRRTLVTHAGVFLACLLATALATWPLAAEIASAGPGEKFLDTYYIGRYLLRAPLTEWLWPQLDQLNYPDSGSAVLVALPQFFLARGLDWLLPVNVALNLSMLLHQAAGAYAGYRLAWRIWGPAEPRGLAELTPLLGAGLAFGLCAHALSVFANGQPENLGLVYVALAAEGGWLLIAERRWLGLPWMLLAASLAFVSSLYLMMALLLAAWPLGLWALIRRPGPQSWGGAAALLGVCLAWTLHFTPASAGTEGRLLCPAENSGALDEARVLALGQDPLSDLLRYPPIDHDVKVVDPARLWRPGRVQPESTQLYGGHLGLALTALAALGLAAAPRFGRRALLACAATPLLLALGPKVVLNGWVPTWGGGVLGLPLMGLEALPGLGRVFRTIQFPERLILGAVLPLSLALPPAIGALRARLPRAPQVALLALLPLVEQLTLGPAGPPVPLYSYQPPEAYVALAQEPDGLAVLDMPPAGWEPERAVYADAAGTPMPPPLNWLRFLVRGAATHGHPVPYGGCVEGTTFFNGAAQHSDLARMLADVALGIGTERSIAPAARELRKQGYGWFVLHQGTGLLTPEQERRVLFVAWRDLKLVFEGEDRSHLFRLPGETPHAGP